MKTEFNKHLKLFIFVSMLTLPINASAYIDPGTGSYILQMIAAGVLGGLFAIKMFWLQIKQFFKGIFSKKKV